MFVSVYTKPNCMACNQTKRLLDKLDVDYAEAPITEDVLAFAKDRGLTQAPIVTVHRVGDTINEASAWAGFHPDRIKKLAEQR